MDSVPDKNHKFGIIYLSYVPEGLNVKILREIMETFGEVGRIYLEPEKNNKKHRTYVEGWIEFQKKRVAKLVAKTLNGTALKYGRKHCKMNGQMWSIKYLHKFKWVHLTEQLALDKAVRDKKRRFELSQTKKQVDFYQKMIERSKTRRKPSSQSNNNEVKILRQKRPQSDGKNEFSDEELLSSIFKKVD